MLGSSEIDVENRSGRRCSVGFLAVCGSEIRFVENGVFC